MRLLTFKNTMKKKHGQPLNAFVDLTNPNDPLGRMTIPIPELTAKQFADLDIGRFLSVVTLLSLTFPQPDAL